MNIIRNNTTVEYKILMRQLAMRNEKDHTFINRIQEVIQKYKLEPVEKLIIETTKVERGMEANSETPSAYLLA